MLEPRYVDTREQSRIPPLVQAGFKLQKLDAGDIAFPEMGGETVGIEHKTTARLVSDMVSGVLTRQARRVCELYKYPILMVEGHWTRDPKTGLLTGTGGHTVSWEAMWNELESLQDLGMRLQLATSPKHTISRILDLAEYYAKGYHASVQREVSGNVSLAILNHIYGIGVEKAKVLLLNFNTLEGIVGASLDDIMSVDGFGPVQAKRIYDFWR